MIGSCLCSGLCIRNYRTAQYVKKKSLNLITQSIAVLLRDSNRGISNLNYVFDANVLLANRGLRELVESLIYSSHGCFILLDSNNDYAELKKLFKDSYSKIQTFLIPDVGEDNKDVWRSNLVKSLGAGLYLGSCKSAIEQTRLLGVEAAYIKL